MRLNKIKTSFQPQTLEEIKMATKNKKVYHKIVKKKCYFDCIFTAFIFIVIAFAFFWIVQRFISPFKEIFSSIVIIVPTYLFFKAKFHIPDDIDEIYCMGCKGKLENIQPDGLYVCHKCKYIGTKQGYKWRINDTTKNNN